MEWLLLIRMLNKKMHLTLPCVFSTYSALRSDGLKCCAHYFLHTSSHNTMFTILWHVCIFTFTFRKMSTEIKPLHGQWYCSYSPVDGAAHAHSAPFSNPANIPALEVAGASTPMIASATLQCTAGICIFVFAFLGCFVVAVVARTASSRILSPPYFSALRPRGHLLLYAAVSDLRAWLFLVSRRPHHAQRRAPLNNSQQYTNTKTLALRLRATDNNKHIARAATHGTHDDTQLCVCAVRIYCHRLRCRRRRCLLRRSCCRYHHNNHYLCAKL